MVEPDATLVSQARPEFKTFAVFADKTHGIDLSDSERDEVVQNGSGSARLTADVDDIVDRQASFDGGLLFGWVDFEVTIETEIANDSNTQRGVFRRDLLEAVGTHACPNA